MDSINPDCFECLGIAEKQQSVQEAREKLSVFKQMEWPSELQIEQNRIGALLRSESIYRDYDLSRATEKAAHCPGEIEGECGRVAIKELLKADSVDIAVLYRFREIG